MALEPDNPPMSTPESPEASAGAVAAQSVVATTIQTDSAAPSTTPLTSTESAFTPAPAEPAAAAVETPLSAVAPVATPPAAPAPAAASGNPPVQAPAPATASGNPPVQAPAPLPQAKAQKPSIRQPETNPRRRRSRLLGRLVVSAVWVAILCMTVIAALMISAWITGFRLESGFPDVLGMIDWIRANYLGG